MRSSTSFLTFVILALQLTVYAVPIQERSASDAVGVPISAPPVTGSEYDTEQKRNLFSKPAAPAAAKPVAAPAAAPPAARPVPPPEEKPVTPPKPVTPAAGVTPPKPVTPPAGVTPPVVPSAKTATSSSSAASETGEACVLGTTAAKGKKGRRGCNQSKNIADEGTDAAKNAGTTGTELTIIPPLQPNQIRLTQASTGKQLVGTVGTQIGKGTTAEVFDVQFGTGQQVAKKFLAGKSAAADITNLRAVRKLTGSGKSTLGPDGAEFDWVVSPFVPGLPLTKTPELKAAVLKSDVECRAFFTKTCGLLVQAVEQLEASSRLLMSDLADGNIHWENIDAGTLPGFFDFGRMITRTEKAAFIARFRGAKTTEAYVRARCPQIWNPATFCSGKAGSSSKAGSSQQ